MTIGTLQGIDHSRTDTSHEVEHRELTLDELLHVIDSPFPLHEQTSNPDADSAAVENLPYGDYGALTHEERMERFDWFHDTAKSFRDIPEYWSEHFDPSDFNGKIQFFVDANDFCDAQKALLEATVERLNEFNQTIGADLEPEEHKRKAAVYSFFVQKFKRRIQETETQLRHLSWGMAQADKLICDLNPDKTTPNVDTDNLSAKLIERYPDDINWWGNPVITAEALVSQSKNVSLGTGAVPGEWLKRDLRKHNFMPQRLEDLARLCLDFEVKVKTADASTTFTPEEERIGNLILKLQECNLQFSHSKDSGRVCISAINNVAESNVYPLYSVIR